jgi:hypothetical protein
VTYLETAPGSDELRVVHLDQHATAEQIRRAAATILGRTPTTLAEWLDAADLSSLDPQ